MAGAWSVVEIAGKPADVYEPAGRPRFAILYLHPFGLEMLRDNSAFTSLFAELRLACVCPHGQRSWWADRICPEFDPKITAERYLLEHVVPYFAARWGIAPPGIGLLGISMGGQGALRLAFKHPAIFPVVAGTSSAIDYHERYGQGLALDEMYDSKEQCRQDTALLHVHPNHHPPHIFFCIDPDDREWYRGNDRLHEKLSALGIEHECDLTTRAGGHSWPYFNSMAGRALRFVNAGLEQQARRLI
jgi:S-formylglutathione hydrolase FrmB